jgi:ribonuclease BN (tRNA processing enzyme)
VAREAGVRMLALVHLDKDVQEKALAVAREMFMNTVLPAEGQVFEVEKDRVTTEPTN